MSYRLSLSEMCMALGRHTEGRLMLAGGNCERAKGGATSSKSFIGESCSSGPMV